MPLLLVRANLVAGVLVTVAKVPIAEPKQSIVRQFVSSVRPQRAVACGCRRTGLRVRGWSVWPAEIPVVCQNGVGSMSTVCKFVAGASLVPHYGLFWLAVCAPIAPAKLANYSGPQRCYVVHREGTDHSLAAPARRSSSFNLPCNRRPAITEHIEPLLVEKKVSTFADTSSALQPALCRRTAPRAKHNRSLRIGRREARSQRTRTCTYLS
jgi:hypothetical protein